MSLSGWSFRLPPLSHSPKSWSLASNSLENSTQKVTFSREKVTFSAEKLTFSGEKPTCQPLVNLCQPQKGCKAFVHRRFDNLTTFWIKFPKWISRIERIILIILISFKTLILYTDFIQILFAKDFSTLQLEFFSSFSWFSHFLYLLLQPRMLTNSPIFINNN